MKELVILSGKGGTGKTSITASFARLAERTDRPGAIGPDRSVVVGLALSP